MSYYFIVFEHSLRLCSLTIKGLKNVSGRLYYCHPASVNRFYSFQATFQQKSLIQAHINKFLRTFRTVWILKLLV